MHVFILIIGILCIQDKPDVKPVNLNGKLCLKIKLE